MFTLVVLLNLFSLNVLAAECKPDPTLTRNKLTLILDSQISGLVAFDEVQSFSDDDSSYPVETKDHLNVVRSWGFVRIGSRQTFSPVNSPITVYESWIERRCSTASDPASASCANFCVQETYELDCRH